MNIPKLIMSLCRHSENMDARDLRLTKEDLIVSIAEDIVMYLHVHDVDNSYRCMFLNDIHVKLRALQLTRRLRQEKLIMLLIKAY